MKEEYINRLYYLAKLKNYKGTRDEFVEKLQTDDSYFNYALYMARNDKVKYKGTDEEFSIAIGRTKPQSTQSETAATEETAKVEPTKVEPQVTETITAKVEEPVKEPVVEEKPAIQVKEVEAPKEEVVKKEMPIGENLVPITKKTEVKAVETPSDKLVVKSEKKEEVKEQPKPEEKPQMEVKDVTKKESNKLKIKRKSKLEPIDVKLITKIGSDNKEEKIELIDVKPIEPSKKYKPYGEKGPDVYYSEEYDQYIINEGDKKILAEKGSDKYNELDSKIGDSAKGTKYGTGKCDEQYGGSCSITQILAKEFKDYAFNDGDDVADSGYRYRQGTFSGSEGALISRLEEVEGIYENNNKTLNEIWDGSQRADVWYLDDNLPKDKRFTIYKPYGNDKTLIYDKNTGIIFKQLDMKAPDVDFRSLLPKDKEGLPIHNSSIKREIYQKYQKENPNEGKTVWYGYEKDRPEYKELKSLIEGMDYKKEKGSKNTFVPLTTTPDLTPEWLKNKNTSEQPKMEVKDVTEKKSETPKMEESKGIPSYDDLGINPEKEPGSFLGKSFDKSTIKKYVNRYEKLSPSELVSKGVFKNAANIKLERNKTLRYPDPKGIVFEKTKIGDKTIYPSYDEKNNKWYFYEENSDKNNWTEVTSGVMKTMLNSKYKKWETDVQGENGRFVGIDKSKEDYIDNRDREQIFRLKESILMNKYAPYILKNHDKLSEEEKLKLKEDINYGTFSISPSGGYKFMLNKFLGEDDPSLKFWLDFNDKFLNMNAISEKNPEVKPILNDIKENEKKNYKSDEIIKDINDKKIKVLKSILGDVLYDEKNDLFYYSLGFDRGVAASSDFGEDREFYNFTKIPKGTPAYDKIKNSLSKYNN